MEDIEKRNPDSDSPIIDKDEGDEMEDLDRFIEKREIQNQALKKIAGINSEPAAKTGDE